jgi:hypothetical protein
MASKVRSENVVRNDHQESGFRLSRWVRANAIGLGVAYGLWALFGDGVEALFGVDHDSPVQFIAVMVGLAIGAALFVELRRRVLAPHIDGSMKLALAAGVALILGVIVGFGVAGPPFDFVLGVISLGTIGGAVQWRTVRDQLPRPGGLLLANIGGWLLAGVAVTATAFLAGDTIDAAFGSGLTGFVAILTVLGLIGGAVGGVIEGAALRRRLDGGS